ncbi:protein ecdysoneless homolog isoform X1 [Hyalella azteca]|uniref:Protein ecdysoneless homolog isoform X1 n=1 Tax=Hyalella azteca TaxID=294128 RepID=A0A8B7PRU8_HYAAZ|nr:protein ecdysoneless homolog isoform X1 [Hyalella azteca]
MASCNDIIQYWLLPLQTDGTVVTDAAELKSFCQVYLTALHPHTESYIWNQDPFNLRVVQEDVSHGLEGAVSSHLYGESCVGDYIEDEWFIMFLLRKLSSEFPQLVIRVCDTDGEFLLVEAADHLPAWADPETAEQRVLLYRGRIHLLSPSVVPSAEPSAVLPIMDAVKAVTSRPSETLASPLIQEAIGLRLKDYPGRVRREQHVAHAYVPVGVAALLREYPTLVAPAVTAFCSRDQMDLKALRVMRHFPPEQRVMTAVKFSKALYAKLQASLYTPDHKTGWNLPPLSHKEHKQHLLGVKLACGFELLVCNAGGVTPLSSPSEQAPPETVTANPRWGRYKKTLTERGYFRGELEGSKLYKELESNASRYFSEHLLKKDPNSDASMDTLSAGAVVIKLLPSVNADLDFFVERQNRLVPADDDSWLTITPELLDEELQKRYGNSESNPASTDELQADLQALMTHQSDYEGVEMPQDLQERLRKLSTMSLPRRKQSQSASRKASHARKVSQLSVHPQARKISSQSNASNSSEMSTLSSKVDFNADSFMDALKNSMELEVPEDDYWLGSDEESGMSSYGDESSEGEELLRKTSNASRDSATSSGEVSSSSSHKDSRELRAVMRGVEEELRSTTIADTLRPRHSSSTDDDEFDDVEDFAPVKVDRQTVEQLVKCYASEKGQQPGPASTLFNFIGAKPN